MKIVIVGLGSIAKKHIAAIRSLNVNCELFALRRLQSSSEEDGINNIYDLNDIQSIKPDFIIISNPTSCHENTIVALMKFNVPLFIEKPLSHNLKIEKLLKKNLHILTYIACDMRFLESILWLKNQLIGKRINEVNVYCGSYLPQWRTNIDWRKNYSANKAMGGGVHLDLIHEIDYIYWFFGQPLNVHKVLRNVSSLEIDSIDYANYTLNYPNFAVSIILNYYRRDYKRTIEVVFDTETWLVDLVENKVICGKNTLFYKESTPMDTYIAQMKYFLELVKNKENNSMNSIEDAFNVLKISLYDELAK